MTRSAWTRATAGTSRGCKAALRFNLGQARAAARACPRTGLFDLTCDALDRIKAGRVSKREIIRRLGTSPAQFYRLIDTTNYTKSVDAMLDLLRVLGCEVDIVVRDRRGRSVPLKGASVCAEDEAAGRYGGETDHNDEASALPA